MFFNCSCRYPCVALSKDGNIVITRCTCVASSDGRCCHVAALLYLVEDLSMNNEPRIKVSKTSQKQKWGQGAAGVRDPGRIFSKDKDYGKKRFRPSHLIDIDPRRKRSKLSPDQKADYLIRDIQLAHPNSTSGLETSMLLRYGHWRNFLLSLSCSLYHSQN